MVASLAAFTESTTAGIVTVVFFVLYQQLENHLLRPLIFARTVKLNPLTVLIAILVAVELAGILGALLAIPVAGILQIVARGVWDTRRGKFKEQAVGGAGADPDRRRAPAAGGGRHGEVSPRRRGQPAHRTRGMGLPHRHWVVGGRWKEARYG